MRYRFVKWEDSSTNPTRPLTVTGDAAVSATYELVKHSLTVDSSLIGVTFNIGGAPMSYETPWNGMLEEGNYVVTMPSNVQVGSDIYNFKQWEDMSTSPVRTVNLTADMEIGATYELYTPPPPTKAYLQVHAFLDTVEVQADCTINELGQTLKTPATVEVDPGTYTIKVVYQNLSQTKTVSVVEGQTLRVDAQLTTPTSPFSRMLEWWNRRNMTEKVTIAGSVTIMIIAGVSLKVRAK